jgi:hypothetical protein
LEVLSKYPPVFTSDMNKLMEEEVIEVEVLATLSSMQKGKILGPDGITVEFYIGFYDLLKDDFLKVVHESQASGKVLVSINSTFLSLIPKDHDGTSYDNFRPISCCNVIYKLVAKVIDIRIKLLLSEVIFEEQFGFLQKIQIHDGVSLAQEALHSIKTLKQSATILNIDLSKAYDRVNWTFLQPCSSEDGSAPSHDKLDNGCVNSMYFTVLINGSP